MARIHLDHVGHSYDNSLYALEEADIVFEDGLSYALLGPSGCGKTTMLNIISGLLRPSEGSVYLDGVNVTDVPTVRRNIAQVFQFPVVYQTKTVFENLAFPLRCRKWEIGRIRPRVEEVADLLGMTDRLGQSARHLTADERQLVSLGRGLVRQGVAAVLMDEPLTVIDPQMKSDLRRRIKQANERTRHTVIYVTHDQNEAMTFADEVLVMKSGRVVQRGSARDLFENPRNTYVGTFIGSPGMNFIPAERTCDGFGLAGRTLVPAPRSGGVPDAATVAIGIRPEHLTFAGAGEPGIPASINSVQDHGSVRVIDLSVSAATIKMKVKRGLPIPADTIRLNFPADRVRLYVDGELSPG